MLVKRICSACNGQLHEGMRSCEECNGKGFVWENVGIGKATDPSVFLGFEATAV